MPYYTFIFFQLTEKEITVRSAKHEKILREEWAEAERVGVDFSTVRFDKN